MKNAPLDATMERSNLAPRLLWSFFLAWLFLQVPFFLSLAESGQSPIDYLAYQRGAEAIEGGESPYLAPEESREIFRLFHRDESELISAHRRGEGQAFLTELTSKAQQPGPYVYPPTLALLVAQLGIGPLAFSALLLISIAGFTWLWLKTTGVHSIWLLLVIGSRDILATLHGGNVELLLLFASLAAAKLIWVRRLVVAAPLVAFVLLIKPFYALLFIALLLLQRMSLKDTTPPGARALIGAGAVMMLLLVAEIYRWGPGSQIEVLNFYLHAGDHLWTALPIADQSPLSFWNRTPLQGLINLGVPVPLAQVSAMGLWFLFLAVTIWQARRTRIDFPMAFALALTLFYWGRPAGYGFSYLELVVAVVIWSSLCGWQRPTFLAVVAAIMASRWWAFAETIQGKSFALLMMQTPEFPWETWVVLPLTWLLLLRALAWRRNEAGPERAKESRDLPAEIAGKQLREPSVDARSRTAIVARGGLQFAALASVSSRCEK